MLIKRAWRGRRSRRNCEQNANRIYPTAKPNFTQQQKSDDKRERYFAGGDPGWIRTSDLQLRRLLLYPLSYGAVLLQFLCGDSFQVYPT